MPVSPALLLSSPPFCRATVTPARPDPHPFRMKQPKRGLAGTPGGCQPHCGAGRSLGLRGSCVIAPPEPGGIVAGFGFCAAPRASRKQPCLQGSSSSNRACEQGTANPPGADGGACLLCSFSTGRSQGQGHNVQRAELALDTGQPVPVKAGNAVGAGPSEKRRGGNSESLPTGHPPPLCVLPRRELSA